MRILITGASGFIGNELVGQLGDHKLLLLSRNALSFAPNITQIQGDLSDIESWVDQVIDFAPEACIHLAWEGLPDYSWGQCLHNFDIGVRFYDVLARAGCRKVFVAGTCWEYGNSQGVVLEEYSPNNLTVFPSFKTSLRLIGESLSREFGFQFVWGRIFFVYGKGQRETSLIPTCMRSLSQGEYPEIRTPEAVNDFIHISDVANAIKTLVESPEAEGVFNISTGRPYQVSEVVKIIAQIMGKENLLVENLYEGVGKGFWGDSSRLTKITGFVPQISLKQGIETLVHGH